MTLSSLRTPRMLGVLVLVLFLLVGCAAFQKERLSTFFTIGHETIEAEFGNRAKLIGHDLTYDHVVKLNGVVIGKVTTLEETDRGTMVASMLVDPGTRAKLGSAPTAYISPTLVTDGVQFLGLRSGGDPGERFADDRIPLERTKLPVYLDDVLNTLSSARAQEGVRSTISQTDATLRQGGSEAVRDLATNAPETLKPAGAVLSAFRGTNPDSDLSQMVTGLRSVASAMTEKEGRFESLVRSMDATTNALAAGARPLSAAVATAPDTLRVTRAGLEDLRPALDKLRRSSEDFRPSARQLDEFLGEFGPVLYRARPVFDDLRDVLHDARPLMDRLVPTAGVGTDVLNDIKGNVFDRVNGPIKDRIYGPFIGKNEYKGSSNPIPTYKMLGYFNSAFSNVFKHYDSNGALARLAAGPGGNSVGGTKFPKSLEQYLETLGLQQPVGPNPSGDGPVPQLGKAEPERAKPQDALPKAPSLPLLGGDR